MANKYIIGRIKNGQVWINKIQQKLFGKELSENEGKEVLIEMAAEDKIRSMAQNNYYHLLLQELSKATGEPLWKWKAFFKHEFLEEKVRHMSLKDGSSIMILPSSADLTIAEMIKHIDDILEWLRDHLPRFIAPDPREYYK